jgi:hypothetical protein
VVRNNLSGLEGVQNSALDRFPTAAARAIGSIGTLVPERERQILVQFAA